MGVALGVRVGVRVGDSVAEPGVGDAAVGEAALGITIEGVGVAGVAVGVGVDDGVPAESDGRGSATMLDVGPEGDATGDGGRAPIGTSVHPASSPAITSAMAAALRCISTG